MRRRGAGAGSPAGGEGDAGLGAGTFSGPPRTSPRRGAGGAEDEDGDEKDNSFRMRVGRLLASTSDREAEQGLKLALAELSAPLRGGSGGGSSAPDLDLPDRLEAFVRVSSVTITRVIPRKPVKAVPRKRPADGAAAGRREEDAPEPPRTSVRIGDAAEHVTRGLAAAMLLMAGPAGDYTATMCVAVPDDVHRLALFADAVLGGADADAAGAAGATPSAASGSPAGDDGSGSGAGAPAGSAGAGAGAAAAAAAAAVPSIDARTTEFAGAVGRASAEARRCALMLLMQLAACRAEGEAHALAVDRVARAAAMSPDIVQRRWGLAASELTALTVAGAAASAGRGASPFTRQLQALAHPSLVPDLGLATAMAAGAGAAALGMGPFGRGGALSAPLVPLAAWMLLALAVVLTLLRALSKAGALARASDPVVRAAIAALPASLEFTPSNVVEADRTWPAPSAPPPLPEAKLAEYRTLFDAIDWEGSGVISSSDARAACERLGLEVDAGAFEGRGTSGGLGFDAFARAMSDHVRPAPGVSASAADVPTRRAKAAAADAESDPAVAELEKMLSDAGESAASAAAAARGVSAGPGASAAGGRAESKGAEDAAGGAAAADADAAEKARIAIVEGEASIASMGKAAVDGSLGKAMGALKPPGPDGSAAFPIPPDLVEHLERVHALLVKEGSDQAEAVARDLEFARGLASATHADATTAGAGGGASATASDAGGAES